MKAALTIAGLALALTAVTGCSDDSEDGAAGAPTDASVEDFCGNFTNFAEELGEAGADADTATVIKAIKGVADDMVATGTPEDIPDDAREGWEVSMDAIEGIDDDATEEEFQNLDEDFSESDQEKADAFDDYLSETCDLA